MIPFYLLSLLLIAMPSRGSTTTDAAYTGHNCSTNSAPNSTATSFKSYLNQLLSNLSSNATGFYNATTAGPAYGLFLCSRDVSANVCKECVVKATSQALLLCPDSQEAVIWYDECTLSYSDKPFSSSAAATSPVLVIWSQRNSSEYVPAKLTEVLAITLETLVPSAAHAADRFATARTTFKDQISFTLYSLAQCTPDLSAADCNACLGEGPTQLSPSCCGGRVLYARCNVRIELKPFYQEVITAKSLPSEEPSPSPKVTPSSPPPNQPPSLPSPPTLLTNKSDK